MFLESLLLSSFDMAESLLMIILCGVVLVKKNRPFYFWATPSYHVKDNSLSVGRERESSILNVFIRNRSQFDSINLAWSTTPN